MNSPIRAHIESDSTDPNVWSCPKRRQRSCKCHHEVVSWWTVMIAIIATDVICSISNASKWWLPVQRPNLIRALDWIRRPLQIVLLCFWVLQDSKSSFRESSCSALLSASAPVPGLDHLVHLLLQLQPLAPFSVQFLSQGVHVGLISQLPQLLL